jgi:hypothetical protein
MRTNTLGYIIGYFALLLVSVVRVAIDCDGLTVVVAFELPMTRTPDSCHRCLLGDRTVFTS